MGELQGWHTHLRTFSIANKTYTLEQLSQIDSRHILQDLKQQVQKTFTLRRTAAAVIMVALTTVGAIAAQEKIQSTNLFYKVYIDGKYVGVVKDRNFVYDKISALGSKLNSQISLVPVHQQLNGGTSEADVSLALNDAANPQVTAIMIQVDGQDAVVVRDETDAKQVLALIKAKFASGDTTVKEVKIDQAIDFRTFRANRDEVRSVDSAVAMLLQGKEKPKKYLVSRGDSLWTIAARNQMTIDKLKQANPQIKDENSLQEGQEIMLNSVEPMVTVETVEEIVRTVPDNYETIYKDDSSLSKGEQRVQTEGVTGEKTQKVQIRKKNGKVYAEVVLSEQIVKDKVDKVVLRGTKIPDSASGDWVWPVASRTVSSAYGEWRGGVRHYAIDISAPAGTPVYAANYGTVIFAGWDGDYGYAIRISHGNGIVSIYAHLSAINVSVGERVEKGDVIGRVGSTGQSTGPHLHYEVRVNGVRVNPAPYM